MTAVTKTLGTTLLALSLASAAEAGPARACLDESEKLVGQRATLADKTLRPRIVRRVEPVLPTRESLTTSSIWVGDALVDQAGKVREVWTVRAPRFDPPWPEFEDAAKAAIRQWAYEPAIENGTAVPFCVTVSVTLHVR
jgi:hypothetical protein